MNKFVEDKILLRQIDSNNRSSGATADNNTHATLLM